MQFQPKEIHKGKRIGHKDIDLKPCEDLTQVEINILKEKAPSTFEHYFEELPTKTIKKSASKNS